MTLQAWHVFFDNSSVSAGILKIPTLLCFRLVVQPNMEQFAPGIAKNRLNTMTLCFPWLNLYDFALQTPSGMHFGFHVTKDNKFFSHMIRPSKPSPYINYGLTNGAGNVVKSIHLHDRNKPSGVIWVQFDHLDVGEKTKCCCC